MQLRIAFYQKNKVLELGSDWEHSLQRDDEGQAKEWRHIVMRQITARYRRAERVHLHVARRGGRTPDAQALLTGVI